MEWGIVIAMAGLFLMAVLLVEEVETETEADSGHVPHWESEYESLAIHVADYQRAV